MDRPCELFAPPDYESFLDKATDDEVRKSLRSKVIRINQHMREYPESYITDVLFKLQRDKYYYAISIPGKQNLSKGVERIKLRAIGLSVIQKYGADDTTEGRDILIEDGQTNTQWTYFLSRKHKHLTFLRKIFYNEDEKPCAVEWTAIGVQISRREALYGKPREE